MKTSGTGRLLATVFLGVILGFYRHYVQLRQLAKGREGFLADQSHYFDRISQLHSMVYTVIACLIVAVVAVCLYEVIAAVFSKMAGPSVVEE